jgi:hypothetical protein
MLHQQPQSQRKPPQVRAIGAPRLAGRPYDGPIALEPEIIPAPEPVKKMGRPPKHGVAMTPAQRQANKRRKAEVDALIHVQGIDDATDGAYGGRYIKDAPKGMGELVSGGYNSEKLEAVDAAYKNNTRRVQSSGAGSNSDMQDRPVFFDVKKYSADFTHRWNLQQEEREWKFILERVMIKKTVCLACDDVIGSHPGLATIEEIDEHFRIHRIATGSTEEFDEYHKTHPLQESERRKYTVNEFRCAVCDEADTDHIRECEFTPEDRKHNRACKLDIFKQAGIPQKKMSGDERAHRSTIRRVRAALRATVTAVEKAVQKDGHILMVDKKYCEFLKPNIPGERHELKSAATSSAEYEAREEATEEDPAISSAELEAREEPPSVPSITAAELKEWEEEDDDAPGEEDPATSVTSGE